MTIISSRLEPPLDAIRKTETIETFNCVKRQDKAHAFEGSGSKIINLIKLSSSHCLI